LLELFLRDVKKIVERPGIGDTVLRSIHPVYDPNRKMDPQEKSQDIVQASRL